MGKIMGNEFIMTLAVTLTGFGIAALCVPIAALLG
jgi:hypothetical protein